MEPYLAVGDFSAFAERLRKGFLFLLTVGTTDTSLIPGITVAGASPELTHYTPAADAEYLVLGRCKSINEVPMTPDGKPTPALLTRAALRAAGAGALIVDAGSRVKPQVPLIDLHGSPGRDIRTGKALDARTLQQTVSDAALLGENLGKSIPALMIGESIPAGTTTAMAFLLAMGYDAWEKMSSSAPTNPRKLKAEAVRQALQAAKAQGAQTDPLEAVSRVGDPVIPAMGALAVGAARGGSHVVLAGGTQMAAVLAFIKAYDARRLPNIAIATTRWVIEDKSADLQGLIAQIAEVPIAYSALDLSDVSYEGLRAFEAGFVKEGVGAGGAMVAAAARGISTAQLKKEIVDDYSALLKAKESGQ
ncbi:TIGR00303 family protein [Tardisphaera miroshnichenkoae]